MFLYLLISVLVTVWMVSTYFRFNRAGRLLSKIPGPKGVYLFNNAFDIILNPDNLFKFARYLQNYGDVAKVTGFHLSYVNIYSPEDFEVILSSSKFNQKSIPYNFMQPWLGEGLLINNGEKWHHRRKLLTPAFHFNILKKFSTIFTEQTREVVNIIQGECDKDRTEVVPIITKHTLRVMCETSMGTSMREDINSVANKYFKGLHLLGQCIVYRMTRLWLYSNFFFSLTKTCWIQKAALNDLHRFTKQIIQERREFRQENALKTTDDDDVIGKKSRLAMLDLLLDQEAQGRIDNDGIREEVDTFMFEGHDTTGTALCFMLMRIANETEAQDKIYEELQSVFGNSNREATIDDLAELKYLECCIKESLRLYPSVPYIARCLKEDVELSGYTVPAGTICNLHIFDLHRRADQYPEPEKFIPERFLPENSAKRHPYAYVPFSAGPRNCIGQRFAMMAMKTVLSGILRKFRVEPVTRLEDLVFTADIVLRVKNEIYVRFRTRL